MNNEEWRDTQALNYEVSNKGRVRNKLTGEIRKEILNSYGYVRISLNGKNYMVHRLVAEAFIPNPDKKYLTQINHIDMNKRNNCVENLEWVSGRQNMKHCIENKKVKHVKARKILCIERNQEFNSIREAARYFNICKTGIEDVLHGRQKTAAGYTWKYI